jgi:hypothetical protein
VTTTVISARQSEERPSSVTLPSFATAYSDSQKPRSIPLFIPSDQAYYWTLAWQRAEAESLREIVEDRATQFESGAAAAEWLLSGDEEE